MGSCYVNRTVSNFQIVISPVYARRDEWSRLWRCRSPTDEFIEKKMRDTVYFTQPQSNITFNIIDFQIFIRK